MRGLAKEFEAMRREWLLLVLALKGNTRAVDLERFAAAGLLHRALANAKEAPASSRFDAAVTAAEDLIKDAMKLESDLRQGTLVVVEDRAPLFVGEHQREGIAQVVSEPILCL